jgi:hypothetical protein
LRVGVLSSGYESRPVKAEPGRPEAGSALEGATPHEFWARAVALDTPRRVVIQASRFGA